MKAQQHGPQGCLTWSGIQQNDKDGLTICLEAADDAGVAK